MTRMTIEQAIEVAWQHHQHGRLAEAESLYRQVLATFPNQPDAMQLLGVLASQVGRIDIAVDLIRQAITINPAQPIYHANLGTALSGAGRWDEAIASLRQAIQLNPRLVEPHINLGNAYLAKSDFDKAIECYRQALALNPQQPEAHNNLGNALRSKGDLSGAIACYRRAIELQPSLPDAHYNLAIVLKQLKQFPESIIQLRESLRLRPNYPEALNNLGNLLQMDGQIAAGRSMFERALELQPNFANALNNLANLLRDEAQFERSTAYYMQAMAAAPEWRLPHYNYALTLLLQGRFEEGWKEHEARRKAPEIEIFIQDFPKPTWDGSELNGKSILIHCEQGFGDAIQFARLVPMVAERGGKVILQCHRELAGLFASLKGVDKLVPVGSPLPEFHFHCPLLSLPLAFKINSMDQIPKKVPYLHAPAASVEKFRQLMEPADGKFKIGLVWAGRAHPPGRSVELSAFAPFAQIPGTAFVSLQFGAPANQVENAPAGMQIIHFTEELKDFTDTAAVLENLDLLITIDTAAGHLAGAMAKPVWVLLPWMPDWRWLMDRKDSPWYPTMRLYRQPIRGDFATPIDHITKDLRALLAAKDPAIE